MAVHNLKITTENLLNVIVQMPENEFKRFIEKAKELRVKQKAVSSEETDLLLKINDIFPIGERERYNELYAKFQNGDITQVEHRELIELSDKFEMLNAQRLEHLGRLAALRNQTLEEAIRGLNLKSASKLNLKD